MNIEYVYIYKSLYIMFHVKYSSPSSVLLLPLFPLSEELSSLIAWGTKVSFSLLVLVLGRSNPSLKRLLSLLMAVCRGCLGLSRMASGFLSVLLSATVPNNRESPPDQLVQHGRVLLWFPAPWASKENEWIFIRELRTKRKFKIKTLNEVLLWS